MKFSWNDSATSEGKLNPSIGTEYNGFVVNGSANLVKGKGPTFDVWMWKEWKF